MDGVLNVLKPPGMTSHDAVAFVRRALNQKRVGHTGTLDPAATGVLVICVGQATRLVEYLQSGTKEYIAEITFGFETDTGDAVGKTISEGDAAHVDLGSLRAALDSFRGSIIQTPPLHSAIKVGGKKLYELAREGQTDVEIPTREVIISELLITKFWNSDEINNTRPRAMLKIECSGGTYIRSLVRDIGRVLGCGATMTFLVRTRSGAFDIETASTLEAISEDVGNAMIATTEVLGLCASQTIEDNEAAHDLSQGKFVALESDAPRVLVWNAARSIAILAVPLDAASDKNYKPEKVLFLTPTEREA